jgi:hypothetical protein
MKFISYTTSEIAKYSASLLESVTSLFAFNLQQTGIFIFRNAMIWPNLTKDVNYLLFMLSKVCQMTKKELKKDVLLLCKIAESEHWVMFRVALVNSITIKTPSKAQSLLSFTVIDPVIDFRLV